MGLRLLQPQDAAELPRRRAGVEWGPIAPYWSVLWRGGVALARELDGMALRGLRVVELGCGPLAEHCRGARRRRRAPHRRMPRSAGAHRAKPRENDVRLETATVEWAKPDELVRRGPFDMVLAADLLYEDASIAPLLSLLPRLAPEAWLADPGRRAGVAFLDQAGSRWPIETSVREVVLIHRLQLC